jgi:hypothetical protein
MIHKPKVRDVNDMHRISSNLTEFTLKMDADVIRKRDLLLYPRTLLHILTAPIKLQDTTFYVAALGLWFFESHNTSRKKSYCRYLQIIFSYTPSCGTDFKK